MSKILGRAIAVWCAIAVAETVHGILRGLYVAPVLGDLRARQVGVFVGSAIILAIACARIRWVGATAPRELRAVGGVWLVLMLSFEVGLGRLLGASWPRLLSDYDPRQGGLMPIGMVILFFSPSMAIWLRRSRGDARTGRAR
jgi:hypothetical protein